MIVRLAYWAMRLREALATGVHELRQQQQLRRGAQQPQQRQQRPPERATGAQTAKKAKQSSSSSSSSSSSYSSSSSSSVLLGRQQHQREQTGSSVHTATASSASSDSSASSSPIALVEQLVRGVVAELSRPASYTSVLTGTSMKPTLNAHVSSPFAAGERLVIRRLGAGVQVDRGDIVVVEDPEDSARKYVRRVVAVHGDELVCDAADGDVSWSAERVLQLSMGEYWVMRDGADEADEDKADAVEPENNNAGGTRRASNNIVAAAGSANAESEQRPEGARSKRVLDADADANAHADSSRGVLAATAADAAARQGTGNNKEALSSEERRHRESGAAGGDAAHHRSHGDDDDDDDEAEEQRRRGLLRLLRRDSRDFGPVRGEQILGRVVYAIRNDVDHGRVRNSGESMLRDELILAVELAPMLNAGGPSS